MPHNLLEKIIKGDTTTDITCSWHAWNHQIWRTHHIEIKVNVIKKKRCKVAQSGADIVKMLLKTIKGHSTSDFTCSRHAWKRQTWRTPHIDINKTRWKRCTMWCQHHKKCHRTCPENYQRRLKLLTLLFHKMPENNKHDAQITLKSKKKGKKSGAKRQCGG